MVPKTGFEPAREVPPPPQDGVSTNSTTSALRKVYLFTGAAGGITGNFAVFGFAAGSFAASGLVTGMACPVTGRLDRSINEELLWLAE